MDKILLIDDDPVSVAVYQTLFAIAGYQVHVASDGSQGLALLHEERPAAVLLDLAMPRINAGLWLATLRDHPQFAALPIVLFTAGGQASPAANDERTFVLSKARSHPESVIAAVHSAVRSPGRA